MRLLKSFLRWLEYDLELEYGIPPFQDAMHQMIYSIDMFEGKLYVLFKKKCFAPALIVGMEGHYFSFEGEAYRVISVDLSDTMEPTVIVEVY